MAHSHVISFGKNVGAYEAGRPDYPPELLLDLPDVARIVDLGAGTGKFTHMLAGEGKTIIAVEPVPAMAECITALPGVEVRIGTAERLPLADDSADMVCCATSFHWFDYTSSTQEMERVLVPRGVLALIWNTRDDSVPWIARVSEILDRYAGSTPRESSGAWRRIFKDERFTHLGSKSYPFAHRMPPAGIVDRVLSTSFIAALPDSEQGQVRALVGQLIGDTPELNAAQIEFAYVTRLYLFQLNKRF
jgi:SAM-dependent methyltransferase